MKILEQYKRQISAEEINSAIENAKKLAAEWKEDPKYLKLAFNCIDLTSLNISDTQNKIATMAKKVADFNRNFEDLPNVAAICVYPNFVQTVRKNLGETKVNVASVTGGFPSSQTFLEIKTHETRLAVQRGADEVDMVISLGEFLQGDYPYIYHEVKKIRKAAGDAHLKVILESGLMENPDEVYKASIISITAGGDFVKTSTGKEKIGATYEAVYTMALAVKDYFEDTGEMIGIKPAGGIATAEQALTFMAIVYNVLGEKWLSNEFFRFGASRLANNLLSEILKQEVQYF